MHYVVGTFLLALITFVLANVAAHRTNEKYPYVLGILSTVAMSMVAGYLCWKGYWGVDIDSATWNVFCVLFWVLVAEVCHLTIVHYSKIEKKFFLIMLLTNAVTIIVSACFMCPLFLG